jgi:hypothetical protein
MGATIKKLLYCPGITIGAAVGIVFLLCFPFMSIETFGAIS